MAAFVPAVAERFFALNTTPPQFYVRRGANNFPATLSEIQVRARSALANNQVPRWDRL